MKKYLILILFAVMLISCKNNTKSIQPTPISQGYDTLTYKTFRVDTGWGYDILRNGKVFIHQPFIPSVQGKFVFRTREDARKTAILVIHRMMERPGLPTLEVEELDSLGVLYDTVIKFQIYWHKVNRVPMNQ